MLDESSTLTDVSFAVCTALDDAGMIAVLCGGAAATYYSETAYQSLDADFVFRGGISIDRVRRCMDMLGFTYAAAGYFHHARSVYTVEFPRGPLAIGRDLVDEHAVIARGAERLRIVTVTDCVRDRFMHFWAWNDRSALDVAVLVAARHVDTFDREAFVAWTDREREADRSYDPSRVAAFLARIAETRE